MPAGIVVCAFAYILHFKPDDGGGTGENFHARAVLGFGGWRLARFYSDFAGDYSFWFSLAAGAFFAKLLMKCYLVLPAIDRFGKEFNKGIGHAGYAANGIGNG